MFTLFIVLHVIFCIFLILVILLQTGKGSGIGAAFGGGGSQTVFGPRGAGSFIGKITGAVAGLFMITSIVLAFLSTSRSDNVAKAVEALKSEQAKAVESVSLSTPKDVEKETPTKTVEEPAADQNNEEAVKDKIDSEAAETQKPSDEAAAKPNEDAEEKSADKASLPVGLKPSAPAAEEKPAAEIPPQKPSNDEDEDEE